MRNWHYLFSLLAPALLLLGACSSFKEPELKAIEHVKSPTLGLKNSTLTLDLHCYNPNKSRIRFKKAAGEAWVDGQKLGDFRIDTAMTIPSRSDFWLPVILDLDMKNALKNSASLFLKDEVELKIEGKARLGKSGFFFNYPISYLGKQSIGQYMK
ncbi:MAG: LEA type 2 family protein [Sphingobacteriales bacterium]|nr:LEA type 2 family protein [Sphingobacteriales bacterium]